MMEDEPVAPPTALITPPIKPPTPIIAPIIRPAVDGSCGEVTFMGSSLTGCCTEQGLCGVLSSLDNSCLERSLVPITPPLEPQTCGN